MQREAIMEARRRQLLEQLERYAQDGVQRVNWLTTQDDRVCPRCAAREPRVFAIAEARAELQGAFCEAHDSALGCRCTLTVVESAFDEMP
jgi:hypothetical protein